MKTKITYPNSVKKEDITISCERESGKVKKIWFNAPGNNQLISIEKKDGCLFVEINGQSEVID